MQAGGDQGASGQQSILDILKNQQNHAKDLINDIGNSKDPQKTAQMMAQLRTTLIPQMKAEERTFYPPLEQNMKTRELAAQARVQNQQIQNMLIQMASMKGNDPEWQARYNVLKNDADRHFSFEQNQLFDKAKNVLNKQQQNQLAQQYISARNQETAQLNVAKAGPNM